MSTRQAPGSSMVPLAPSMNSKKRSTSEAGADLENSRSCKKTKRDDGTKDKKKRSRKKKRKSSVVTTVKLDLHARSKSRSATVATQDTAQEVDVKPEIVLDEEAQPSKDFNQADDMEDTSPRIPYADKGKGKAKQESLSPVVESPESQIARLQQEIELQHLLLTQHQSHLAQVHQSLTCQICLDLLHKPFALAPCGHIVCYPCLVRWFTAPQALGELHNLQDITGPPETSHCYRKKKCPVCRTHIIERPVEVWGVKSMVTGLVRSGLVELSAPAPAPETESSTSTSDDPWRNIFHNISPNRFFLDVLEPRPPRSGAEGLEEIGMYDADDGGIYRCIDCMHEIWRGVCTHCHREYPGHRASEDDEDDEELEFDAGGEFRDILHMFANAPNTYLGDDGEFMDSDSEDSAIIFGEEIDDEEDNEEGGHNFVIPRTHNPAPPGAPRTLGHPYYNPLDDLIPIGRAAEEEGITRIGEVHAHIDEGPVDESGNETDEYEDSFIDDSEIPQLVPSSERSSCSGRQRRRLPRRGQGHVSHGSDEEDSDIEIAVTEGAARQLGRATRFRRPMVSDGDEALSDFPPIRTTSRRARTIIELTDDSENENLWEEDNDDDDDDERTYEDDGSRSGPSSRLLRLMQQPDINEDEDEDKDGNADTDAEW